MPMRVQVERYRREAERCRHLASQARDGTVRETWLSLAQEYDSLATAAAGLRYRFGFLSSAEAAD